MTQTERETRAEVWAVVREAILAGESLGTIGPAFGVEHLDAKRDAYAREFGDRLERLLSERVGRLLANPGAN